MTVRAYFLIGTFALVIAIAGVTRADYVVAVAAALTGGVLIAQGVRQGPAE